MSNPTQDVIRTNLKLGHQCIKLFNNNSRVTLWYSSVTSYDFTVENEKFYVELSTIFASVEKMSRCEVVVRFWNRPYKESDENLLQRQVPINFPLSSLVNLNRDLVSHAMPSKHSI